MTPLGDPAATRRWTPSGWCCCVLGLLATLVAMGLAARLHVSTKGGESPCVQELASTAIADALEAESPVDGHETALLPRITAAPVGAPSFEGGSPDGRLCPASPCGQACQRRPAPIRGPPATRGTLPSRLG